MKIKKSLAIQRLILYINKKQKTLVARKLNKFLSREVEGLAR